MGRVGLVCGGGGVDEWRVEDEWDGGRCAYQNGSVGVNLDGWVPVLVAMHLFL